MKEGFFRPPGAFSSRERYKILPFRFMRWSADEVFLSTDVGESLFLSSEAFKRFTDGTLEPNDPAYAELKSKHVLVDSDPGVALQLLATKYRTKMSFLEGFTRLHIFVVTLRCDHSCPYCQVSRVTKDRSRYDMASSTWAKAVDFLFRSPAPALKVEFQGGESLLNFEAIRAIVDAVEERNKAESRAIDFVVATNLAHLTDDMLDYLADHSVHVSTSLDGPDWLHNANRPRPGADSHERMVENLERVRARLGHDRVSALMTTTGRSLECPLEIVDEYVRLRFDAVFLRPISPYGFAVRSRHALRYGTDAFLGFYKAALDRVMEWNRRGYAMAEVYSQILLRKVLTPFGTGYVDLQSPAGLGISAVVFNYDGDVYASDEGRMLAEMGDTSFRLGNLHTDAYESVMGGAQLRGIIEQSCAEAAPGCSECAFLPFCGSDPVFHWATQGDVVGHKPTSAFCARNMATIRHLFELLRGTDRFTRDLLTRWAVQ